jgi:hypothetical protein
MRPGPAATGTRSRRTETGPVSRPSLEVADIFRDHGQAWRRAAKGVSGAGHVSLTQQEVMAAIEACRTAALGGHVAACTACGRCWLESRHRSPATDPTLVYEYTTYGRARCSPSISSSTVSKTPR